MKIRIGLSAGAGLEEPTRLAEMAVDMSELGFDSLWLPEILTAPVVDPLIGLGWVASQVPKLKLGTTMILPGRNPLALAKAVASLDALSGGRFLVTFVPGLPRGPERGAIGVLPEQRGAEMDEVMPLLRRLWAGERLSYHGSGIELHDVALSPIPVQQPFDVWLGGQVRASLLRCGRLFDGWLPAMTTPEDAASGRLVIEQAAAESGRSISEEHFGVSLIYSHEPLPEPASGPLAVLARGRPLKDLIPVGFDALRQQLERFIAVGFSKFVIRPTSVPGRWREELEHLALAVGSLQT